MGRFEVIDAQVHLAAHESASDLLEPMEPAGVDAAVIVNQSIHGPDNSRQLAAVAAYPQRLALVAGLDLNSPDLEAAVRALRATLGVIGVRVVLLQPEAIALFAAGAHARLFAAAERYRLPVCVFAPTRSREIGALCEVHPALHVVFDHMNLANSQQSRKALGLPPGRHFLEEIVEVLDLARLPNVFLKISALPAFSAQPYPFADIWPLLHRIVSTFGPERLMWGSDRTVHRDRCSYEEMVAIIRDTSELSQSDKEWILGKSLRAVFDWATQSFFERAVRP